MTPGRTHLRDPKSNSGTIATVYNLNKICKHNLWGPTLGAGHLRNL